MTMQQDTRLALEADIAHWNVNAYVVRPDQYSTAAEDSALCRDFRHNLCEGCPIKEATGLTHCKGTFAPAAHAAWLKWKYWLFEKPNVSKAHKQMQECRKLAFNQEEFLRGLHPDNTEHEWEVPNGVVASLTVALEAAAHGAEQVAMLCKGNPQRRGLLQKTREKFKADVSVRRYPKKVMFKNGGAVHFVIKPEEWEALEIDKVHVYEVPTMMLPHDVKDLYTRINGE